MGTMKNIAVLTSGGDAPGMNAAIRAIVRRGLDQGLGIYGVRQGFQGLVDNSMDRLSARDVGGIIQRGGTFLGSARSHEYRTDAGRTQALRNLRTRSIDALVVIGGNGSQTGAAALSELGFPVLGVASTIDNDLVGSDITIGVDTALNVTLEAIDRLRTTGSSHQRAFLVETMGRNCGYLALMAGLAGGAEVIATPEYEVTPAEVAARLRAAYERGKTHAIIVCAEGAKNGAAAIMQHFRDNEETRTGFELRITQLGHVVRGAAPTAADRILATRLGVAAVDALAHSVTGALVGMVRGEIAYTPLSDVKDRTKPIDFALMELAMVLAR
jgi:6-phosphofructokinase 1